MPGNRSLRERPLSRSRFQNRLPSVSNTGELSEVNASDQIVLPSIASGVIPTRPSSLATHRSLMATSGVMSRTQSQLPNILGSRGEVVPRAFDSSGAPNGFTPIAAALSSSRQQNEAQNLGGSSLFTQSRDSSQRSVISDLDTNSLVHDAQPRLLARPQTARRNLRTVDESGSTSSVIKSNISAPFEFALSKKTNQFEITQVPEHLLGLEVEYQKIHYTPPQNSSGSYERLEKSILACTKEQDAAGNHLLKIVGEGQYFDDASSHDNACIEVVSAPLTHEQWKNGQGVLGAYKVIQNITEEIWEGNRTLLLKDFVSEYNQKLLVAGVDSNFAMTIPIERFANITLERSNKRQATSVQSNFTMPLELLAKNYLILEKLTTSTRSNNKKVAEKTERQKRRARDSLIFSEKIMDALPVQGCNRRKLRSFFFLFLMIESTHAQEYAINPNRVSKFMYPWLCKATFIDIIYSVLTKKEREVIYSYMSTHASALHRMVESSAKVKVGFSEWADVHLNPITWALKNSRSEDREGLSEVNNIQVDREGNGHIDDFYPIEQGAGRLPPLDVNGTPSVVIEAREVSKINRIPTAELLQELEKLYR